MKINNTSIGENYPPYIVAEMSANHNGNIDTLRPNNGLNIKFLDLVVNSRAIKNLKSGKPLKIEDIK